MKANTKFSQCLLVLSLFTMACSKSSQPVSETLAINNDKSKAKTSAYSIIGCWKDNTTSVTTLDVNPGGQAYAKVLYSIGPFNVEAGDIISAHLQQELTNNGPHHLMTAAGITVATNTNATISTSPGYIGMLSRLATSNLAVQYEGDAEILTRSGSYYFATAADNIYINAVFYGKEMMAGTGTPDLVVPAGAYGELVCVQERGVIRYETGTHQPTLPKDPATGKWIAPIDGVKRVQYSIGPVNVPKMGQSGTMVDIRYQLEATSEAPPTADFQNLGRYTIKATSATATTGAYLSNPAIAAVPRYSEHHHTWSQVGGLHLPDSVSGAYFNSVLYGGGTAISPGMTIEPQQHNLYGHFVVEMRPYVGLYNDLARDITYANSTQRVLYSRGPIRVEVGDVVEIRYVAAFGKPTSVLPLNTKIVRGNGVLVTAGTTVQPPLYRKIGPKYTSTLADHSTAEKITVAGDVFYNVVVWSPNSTGGTIPINDYGELEVVVRRP